MDKQLAEQIASWFGVSSTDFQSAITNEDGSEKDTAGILKFLEDSYKSRLDKYGKTKFDTGTRAAKKTVESAIKEKFDVTGENYEDFLLELEEKINNSGKPSKDGEKDLKDFTIEDLQEHPDFQKALEASQSEVVDNWKTKYETDIKEREKQIQALKSQRLLDVGVRQASSLLSKEKAVGSESEHFQNAVETYLRGIGIDNLKLGEDGKTILVMDGEEQKTDDYGNKVTFDKYVLNNWHFGFNKAPGGDSPSRGGDNGGSRGGIQPINEKEYNRRMEAASSAKERAEAQHAYAAYLEQNGE